jgi:hypothetical protein
MPIARNEQFDCFAITVEGRVRTTAGFACVHRALPVVLAIGLTLGGHAQAETVYEFVLDCKSKTLARCFNLIEQRLNRMRAIEQGRAFCLPRVWGAAMVTSESYPVSVLDHVRLGLSAARFGAAERPVEERMKAIIAEIYPCR